MRERPIAAGMLWLAAFLHLPVVYLILADDIAPPPVALSLGLLAMGLAWAGGCALEGRRGGSVISLAALGSAEVLAYLLIPYIAQNVGASAAPWLGGASLASATAGVILFRARQGTRANPR